MATIVNIIPGHDKDAYNFVACFDLARSELSDALTNPDNMRVFSEMCYMWNTMWLATKPTS